MGGAIKEPGLGCLGLREGVGLIAVLVEQECLEAGADRLPVSVDGAREGLDGRHYHLVHCARGDGLLQLAAARVEGFLGCGRLADVVERKGALLVLGHGVIGPGLEVRLAAAAAGALHRVAVR